MIDQAAALSLAKALVAEHSRASSIPMRVMDDATHDAGFGWVFFHNSVAYLEHGEFSDALAGNCPVFVSRDGRVELLPTHTPWEQSLKKFAPDA